jgi:hypothetical protein
LHRFDDTIPPLVRHLIGEQTADLLAVPKSNLSDDLSRLARIAKLVFRARLGPGRARLAPLPTDVANGLSIRARAADLAVQV